MLSGLIFIYIIIFKFCPQAKKLKINKLYFLFFSQPGLAPGLAPLGSAPGRVMVMGGQVLRLRSSRVLNFSESSIRKFIIHDEYIGTRIRAV